MWADWQMDVPVDKTLLDRVDATWDASDESFCSAPDRHDPKVLSLSFEIAANTYDAAEAMALLRVNALAQDLALPGELVKLVGYTDDTQYESDLGSA